MATPTVIKHKLTAEGFAVVVTVLGTNGFEARAQQYVILTDDFVRLEAESIWSTEAGAKNAFKDFS